MFDGTRRGHISTSKWLMSSFWIAPAGCNSCGNVDIWQVDQGAGCRNGVSKSLAHLRVLPSIS